MASGRATFYVATPEPPSQRHSMFVDHTELERKTKQDLSSASSSATLPSTAGSVDRLTGLGEKKKKTPRFFTLRPKTSFSLRPFFSSSSISALAPSAFKRHQKSTKATTSCTSVYVQTDEGVQSYDEVGVQTQNASTVDVPVQTCFTEWEDDKYSYSRRPFAAGAYRSVYSRGPSAEYSFNRPSSSVLKPSNSASEVLSDRKHYSTVPSYLPKLLTYAPSCDLAAFPSNKSAAVSETTTLKSQEAPAASENVQKDVLEKPLSNDTPTSSKESPTKLNQKPVIPVPLVPTLLELYNDTPEVNTKHQSPQSVNTENAFKSATDTSQIPPLEDTEEEDSSNPEVSAKLIVLSSPSERLPSALKIERSDSPVKHSAKIKTVHFELAPTELNTPVSKKEPSLINAATLDKDFEELLRTLDILSDDPFGSSYGSSDKNVNISSNSVAGIPLSQTVLADKFESAFEIPGQDVLPPILENLNETSEIEQPVLTKGNEPIYNVERKNTEILLNPNSPSLVFVAGTANDVKENKYPPTFKQNRDQNKLKGLENTALKTPSSTKFIPSKLDSDVANDISLKTDDDDKTRGNNLKDITLPSLPSFFDSTLKCNAPGADDVVKEEANIMTACEVFAKDTCNENTLLSRSSSSTSKTNSDFGTFFDSPSRSLESFNNSVRLEEELIRSSEAKGKKFEERKDLFNLGSISPISFERKVFNPAHIRGAVLDRLLDSGSDKSIGNKEKSTSPIQAIEAQQGKVNTRQATKHVATLMTFDSNPTGTTQNYPLAAENSSSNMSLRQGNTSSRQPGIAEYHKTHDLMENKVIPDNSSGGACDFSNCLRPSEIQTSNFLNKINSASMPSKPYPEQQNNTPNYFLSTSDLQNSDANSLQPNGQCDYANCLKPSEVHNSGFTTTLSENIVNKSSNSEYVRTNSPLAERTNNPLATNTPLFRRSPTKKKDADTVLERGPTDESSHTSELTIVLQTSSRNELQELEKQNDLRSPLTQETMEQPPVYCMKKEIQLEPSSSQWSSSSLKTTMEGPKTVQITSEVSPPPPPPPPPTTPNRIALLTSKAENRESQSISPALEKVISPTEPKSTYSKSPVMVELENHLQNQKNGREARNQKTMDMTQSRFTPDSKEEIKSEIDNVFKDPFTIRNECNGRNGFSPQPRESFSPVSDGRNDFDFIRKRTFSPEAHITDDPPPEGAILVDEKVTFEGDKVHTDKYYAIPLKEVCKETTSTTKFIPAPPKYEGIGPTEDGIPTGLRNSVKKENMHNWYKTMFKSLHKMDSSNDPQEYVIGYSSEPETNKKEKSSWKKSSTLDNRSGHYAVKSTDNIHKQVYPPSAKSSIDVYNVQPRLIEDYEPGSSSVTDDEITIGYKRHLPDLKAPKMSYEFKNGYEQENNFIRNLSPSYGPNPEQQKVWYKDVQKGYDIPQFGLGKPAPEKLQEPVIGPLPPPPLNYHGPTSPPQATRPLTLPSNYQNDNGFCQQSNGPYEVQMRHALHTELQQRSSPSPYQLSPPSRSILKSPSRSPDLKLPARALFDFTAETVKEIPLKKGELVLILRQLDKNWYEGERQGRIGIFPVSYVEIVPPEHVSTPTKVYVEGTGKVLYDFTAHSSAELSVHKGDTLRLRRRVDSNWFEAQLNIKKGIIPASYLQVIQEPYEKDAVSPSKSCLRSPRSHSETRNGLNYPSSVNNNSPPGRVTFHSRGKKSSSLIEPVMYKALYSYSPQNSDELEISEGDVICVVELCDDGWFVGTSVRTGVFGIFPGNYVEKV